MATVYRITFGFAGPQGWTENHAMDNSSDNPNDLVPTLQDIAAKRAAMLGREFYINAIRIAPYSSDARVRRKGAILVKKTFANPNQTAAYAAEPAVVAYQVIGYASPSQVNPQFNGNTSKFFLGGPIDTTVDNAGQVDTGKAGLQAAFQQWAQAMLPANLGWLSYPVISDTPLAAVAQNTDGTVKITVVGGFNPALTPGVRYPARIRGINSGRSPLNGPVIIKSNLDGTANTVEPIAFALAQVEGAIKVYDPIAYFVDFGSLNLSDTTVKHKRGKPFLSPPGRAKRRVRA